MSWKQNKSKNYRNNSQGYKNNQNSRRRNKRRYYDEQPPIEKQESIDRDLLWAKFKGMKVEETGDEVYTKCWLWGDQEHITVRGGPNDNYPIFTCSCLHELPIPDYQGQAIEMKRIKCNVYIFYPDKLKHPERSVGPSSSPSRKEEEEEVEMKDG